MSEQTDCAIACLIRSFDKTYETICAYIGELARKDTPRAEKDNSDISDDVFYAVVNAEKSNELTHVYGETYFNYKNSDNQKCLMAALIHDYARKIKSKLKDIEKKIS